MCGIIGVVSQIKNNVCYELLEGLLSLQHRGQDSSGISNGVNCIKKKGYAINVFDKDALDNLKGNMCIGHVRYATNTFNDIKHIQPFNTNISDDCNVSMVHNGNVINTQQIKEELFSRYGMISEESSDSMLVFQLFMAKLCLDYDEVISKENIFDIILYLQDVLVGSFSIIITFANKGLVCFRDRYGIRPLQYGFEEDTNSHLISSETGVYEVLNYTFVRDIKPGEIMYISKDDCEITSKFNKNCYMIPCLFEYLYFSRPDTYFNDISVYKARILIGELLGKKILKLREKENIEIDCIVPVPDTSRVFATGVCNILDIPYHEALVKNRYIDRTFIIENKNEINKNIKRKLNTIDYLVKDKNVLLVDDSIVRGNTSKYVVSLLKNAGAKKIMISSASPPVKYRNDFGIFIESSNECIAFERSYSEIEDILGIDKVIYNDLNEITSALKELNGNITDFECSMFNNEKCYEKYL